MTNKKLKVVLTEKVYDQVLQLVNYRNTRVKLKKENKQLTTVNEFVNGSVTKVIKWIGDERVNCIEVNVSNVSDVERLIGDSELKNRFREIVKQRRMKEKDLAQMTGMHQGSLSVILSNRSQPSLDSFLRIWVALDCPPLTECLYRENS